MQAFSSHNPNEQIAWDASSLKSLQFCPRYYQYANLEGWKSPSVDLAFGGLVSSGFERYQKARLVGKSRDDALLEVVRWAMEETYYEGAVGVGVGDTPGLQWNEPDTQWGGHYEDLWKCSG